MRAVINKMSLKFESHSVNEAFARQAVGAFVAQLDPTMEELGDIKTVVSEAVTNAIVHGYADKCGFITVTVRLFEGRALELKVKDAGCGIENVEQARQPCSPRATTRAAAWDHYHGDIHGQNARALHAGRERWLRWSRC